MRQELGKDDGDNRTGGRARVGGIVAGGGSRASRVARYSAGRVTAELCSRACSKERYTFGGEGRRMKAREEGDVVHGPMAAAWKVECQKITTRMVIFGRYTCWVR